MSRVHAAFYDEKTGCESWKQTREKQVNFFEDISAHFPMQNGYVTLKGSEPAFPKQGSQEWQNLLNYAKVGVVSRAEVTYGHRYEDRSCGTWMAEKCEGKKIDQIFCAAVNLSQGNSGVFNSRQKDGERKAQFALQVAYEGAYLSAIRNKSPHLFLTLIGGGVFGNSKEWISEAIINAHLKYTTTAASLDLQSVKVVLFRESDVSESFFELLKAFQVPFSFHKYTRGQKKLVEKFEPQQDF